MRQGHRNLGRRELVAMALMVIGAAGAAAQAQNAAAMIAEVVRGGSVIVRGIVFAPQAESMSPASEPALREIRRMLLEHDEWSFEVQVHTDDGGDPERDLRLATARARAIVAALITSGISPERLVARGHGPGQRLASSPGAPALAPDRVGLRKLNEE